MQEKKFEQQVQEGLGELAFSPSAGVWPAVQERIARRRRRRRALVWLPLLLVAGGLGVWGVEQGLRETGDQQVASGVKQETREMREMREMPAPLAGTPQSQKVLEANPEAQNLKQKGLTNDQKEFKVRTETKVKVSVPISKDVLLPHDEQQGIVANSPFTPDASSYSRISRISRISRVFPLAPPDSAHYQPLVRVLTGPGRQPARESAYFLSFSAGIGTMSNSFALLPGMQASRSAAYSDPTTGGMGQGGFFSRRPSSVRPGAAFSIGVLRQQPLGGRWNLAAGLQYRYLSTRRFVGARYGDTVINRGFSRSALALQNYFGSSPRADEGLDYTSRYHYMEVPIHVGLTLNRKGTLRAEAGLAGARLLHTNGVLFDTASGIYYNDRAAFRSWSATAGAGLSVQLLRIGERTLEAGPSFQWGLVPVTKGTGDRPISVQLNTRIRF